MFQFIILVVVLAGILFILVSVAGRPLAQWLRNRGNQDQREHERSMEDIKHRNWKEKKMLETRQPSDD